MLNEEHLLKKMFTFFWKFLENTSFLMFDFENSISKLNIQN